MKKKMVLLLITSICLSLFLTGCGSDTPTFEQKAATSINNISGKTKELESTVVDLQKQLDSLKTKINAGPSGKITKDKLKFSSIRLETLHGSKVNNVVTVDANSKVNFKIDIMNATDQNLSQYDCQIYIKYVNGTNTTDIYQNNQVFDAMAATLKKDIEFKDVPIKGSDLKHILTVKIKDNFGNIINTYEKELKVK